MLGFLNTVDGCLWIDFGLKNSLKITSMLLKETVSGKDKPNEEYGSNELLQLNSLQK